MAGGYLSGDQKTHWCSFTSDGEKEFSYHIEIRRRSRNDPGGGGGVPQLVKAVNVPVGEGSWRKTQDLSVPLPVSVFGGCHLQFFASAKYKSYHLNTDDVRILQTRLKIEEQKALRMKTELLTKNLAYKSQKDLIVDIKNAFPPIHRLPPEVLNAIFRAYIDANRDKPLIQLLLMKICSI
ncbi:hypothetical protein BDP27DRAFT_1364645 [Rhodocollybia butyracea]|uniref:Uncharacterized protein n=1 Tax=Rhodocollybia butyracea TaxID=206335 RepID=A0A9P5PQU5_9AGAR|nr:hypothetical protein BDP27DRAFT_1364645 [Rhodocollybia butyracea]